MTRVLRTIAGLLALGLASHAAAAQDAPPPTAPKPFFGKAAFLFMPGILTTPVLGGIGPDNLGLNGGSSTRSYLNARFMTVVPTRTFFALVAGVQAQPNFRAVNGTRSNNPVVFYGAVIPFPAVTEATKGWAGLSIDPLGLYYAGGGGNSAYPYGNDFAIEGAFTINFGSKMMTTNPAFGRSAVYILLDQIVTHPPRVAGGGHDHWWPILLAGITIPVGS